MNLSNKWLWWGAGIILIILGLTLKPVSQSSNQVTPPANPTATMVPIMPLPVSPTVVPAGLSTDVTVIDQSAVSASAGNVQPTAPTEVVTAEKSTFATTDSTACLAGQPAAEGASVWLTINGHTFATASGRVFPSGITLTGQSDESGRYCETAQSGPFGPEWVQVP